MLLCPSCGQQNPDGAHFCNACATSLAADAHTPREERKVVTVLFADLVGFTARAERMDPEEVRRLLQPYHARLRSVLERHGGTVEKFIGDAVMALFGAPVAHEDDPERAVRAALAIRDALAEEGEREIRIGITTGEALIALGARPEAGEGIASGDVVNTAARLQVAAPVNGIVVDETTYRASQRAIEYRDAAPVVAKGKAASLPVWQALRARVEAERLSGATLVGRMQELTLLRDTLARVKREREPQLVTLVGVPGIGKSRLVLELFQELDRDPDLVYWRLGRSLPYGEGVTFWALGEIVKAQAGILESDNPEQAEEKLRSAVAAVIPKDTDAAWIERHLRPLAGIETEDVGGAGQRSEAFAAWRRFLEELAEQRATVLVFEDLHWADEALLDFVDHLVDWASRVPILVLATARPELLARRPGWGGGKLNSATILLSPLSDQETESLVRSLLGPTELPLDAHDVLLERAGGNPLYAEEFVRMLTDRRGELTMPESVQGVIAARLDTLAREEKELLQDAAVVGRVFWLGALGRERWTLEQRLHALERKEFVRRERRTSVAGEAEYSFSHALLREVSYEQIPRSQRAAKHRAAAEWIESLGRPEDHAELRAHHFLQAIEYAEAAGEPRGASGGQAVRALAEAGDRALSLNAYPAATRYYERAIAIASGEGDDPRTQCDLLISLGDAQARAGDMPTAKKTFMTAAELGRRTNSPDQLARAALGYGGRLVYGRAGRDSRLVPLLEEALSALSESEARLRARLLARLAGALRDEASPARRDSLSGQAVKLARRIGDPATLTYALDGRSHAIFAPDNQLERLGIAAELIELAEEIGEAERAAQAYESRAIAYLELGEMVEGETALGAMARLADELRQPAQLWNVAGGRAMLALLRGQHGDAEELIRQALALGEQAQGTEALTAFRLQRYSLGRVQGGLDELESTIRISVEEYPARVVFKCVLSHIYAELGREHEARRVFDELAAGGFKALPRDQEWLFSMSVLAESCAFLGDVKRAAVLYDLLLPHRALAAVDFPEGHAGSMSRYIGVLASTTGRSDEAERHFEDALAMNTKIGARPWLARTQLDYARTLLARGRTGDGDRAGQLLASARKTAQDLGMISLERQTAALREERPLPARGA